MSGLKAQYHYLTLLVISEFDEWRVLLHGPNGVIQGTRSFSESKAKDHALAVARAYIHERRQENLPEISEVAWTTIGPDDWLVSC